MLSFEVEYARIDGTSVDKKFVTYSVTVRRNHTQEMNDIAPVVIERRYTHFLELYNGLKKEHSALLNEFSFPRKMVLGNFDPSLIIDRAIAFQSLLKLIGTELRLQDTPAALCFFRDPELMAAQQLMNKGSYDAALPLLETSFKLLNKVYTEKSCVVIIALCRVVACGVVTEGALAGSVEPWAQLALKRFDTVGDPDLLRLYLPLLRSCISIWDTLGRDKSKLIEELNGCRMRGMNVDSTQSLMEILEDMEGQGNAA